MMIAPIDDGDADRGPGELLCGSEAAKTCSDDDDMLWAQFARPAAFARLLRSAKTMPQMTARPD